MPACLPFMTGSSNKLWSQARVSLILCLLFQSVIIITWGPLSRGELSKGLEQIGVVPLPLPFADFRTITSGVEFYGQGGNPYRDGSYDFMGRAFNYPPIWLKLSFLGLPHEDVRFVYLVLASLFSLGLGMLFWRNTTKAWYLYIPFLYSPPVILALERCNTDLLIFFIIVAAVLLSQGANSSFKNWIAGAFILVASMLKVFPVFGLVCFLRTSWKRSLILIIPIGLLSLAYFFSIRPILTFIQVNTPYSQYLSFGIKVIPHYMAKNYSQALATSIFILAWLAVGIILYRGYRSGRNQLSITDEDAYDVRLFRVGGVLFITAYLLGNSFDYRLIFLLLTLPLVFRLFREDRPNRRMCLSYLILLGIVLWLNDLSPIFRKNEVRYQMAFFINELAGWGVLYWVIIFQFKLLPPFIRKLLYRA